VRVSYLEIYNESVRDLLGKDQNAQLEVSCLDIPVTFRSAFPYNMLILRKIDPKLMYCSPIKQIFVYFCILHGEKRASLFEITVVETTSVGSQTYRFISRLPMHFNVFFVIAFFLKTFFKG
jgi:hypothetical protein